MKEYVKPTIEEEKIELEDVIAASIQIVNDSIDTADKGNASDILN